MRKTWKRLIAAILTVVMLVTTIPTPVLAYIAEKPDTLSVTDKDGKVIETDGSWEETFPYGTFAFQNNQLQIAEGGEEGVIQVYRLGGTAGKAIAYVQYVPAFALIDEDTYTYANAAGAGDVVIRVEDPLPITAYQALGRDSVPGVPAEPVGITVDAPAEEGGDYILTLNEEAAAYQWYVFGEGWEEVVSGATDRDFVVSAEDYAAYDFYCVYTQNGMRYGSNSAKLGKAYEPVEEVLPEMPEDLELNPDPTYSEIEMDAENPYQGYQFALSFADGEWVKEIRISAPQDEAAEPDKFGTFTIVDCEGGSLYDAANTLALHVADDEPAQASQLGFAVTSAEFDKSAGTAKLTVQRTGGTQNVVSVDYATEDGTAIAGQDYTETSGTLLFYADVDEQTIEIPLIDDGVETEDRSTFRVVLSNVLGGGEEDLCTLTEGYETAEISLYNTNTAEEENLATILHVSDAIDISGQVTEQSGSVAPVNAETITGEQVVQDPEVLTATIGSSPMSRSFSYDTPITFSRNSMSNYNSNYWRDSTQLAGNQGSGDIDTFGTAQLGQWGAPSHGRIEAHADGGFCFYCDVNGSSTLTIPNMAHWYHTLNASFKYEAFVGSNAWKNSYTYPWAAIARSNGDIAHRVDCNPRFDDGFFEDTVTYYTTGAISGATWNVDSNYVGLRLGTTKHGDHSSQEPATCHLTNATLRRRYFTNNLNLTIHTSNDSDTAPDGAAVLTKDSGVYASIRPTITIVSKEGGVTSQGRLYVGSKLKIDLPETPTYRVQQITDGSANVDYAVYLTNAGGTIVARAVKGADGDYYLTMDWNSLTNADLNGQYTLNIVMIRNQSLTLNITPSTERRVDADGNMLAEADPAKYGAAWQRFINSGAGGTGVTVGYSATTTNTSSTSSQGPHFPKEIKTATRQIGQITDFAQTLRDLGNLQWINFNRSAEDRIVFNGRTYAGNETIWLTVADLAVSNLQFLYYHKDYLTSESLMVPTIDRIGLYLDVNGNGYIDGYYNRETGYFVLDTDHTGETIDRFVLFLDDDVDYDESIFAPVKINGKYCQYFFKVFYTKIPRCLVPPSGLEDLKAQILPAFISNITNAGVYAELTQEQRSYRYIIAGQNRTSPYGNYASSSDDLLMYGAQASRTEVLDVPLGGDVSPAAINEAGTGFDWTPDFKGNLLYPFAMPEPIFIEHSLAGDNIPIAEVTGKSVDETGAVTLTYGDGGEAKLNGYLGSYSGNSTLALCARVQEQTTAQIAQANGAVGWEGVLPTAASTYSLRNSSEGGEDAPKLEAVTISKSGTYPNSAYTKVMQGTGDKAGESKVDMSQSGNAFSEFNLDMGTKLPSTDIGVTDFVTIIMDGYEVGFSIGLPLGGYDSNGDSGTGGTGASGGSGKGSWDSPADALGAAGEDMGALKDFIKKPGMESARGADDSFSNATDDTDPEMSVHGFQVSFDSAMAFLFKYNPQDNDYYFSEFSIAASAGIEFTYQQRLTPCPIVYLYITIGAGVEIGTGATVERVTKTNELDLPENADSIRKGQSVKFATEYKSFEIEFNGKLLIEVFTDEACTNKATFPVGYIKSDGGDAVTVTLTRKDGFKLGANGQDYYVLLTALEDTEISGLSEITSMETLSYWSGFSISPEAFIEAGAGIGIEILKFEVFIKISIGCSMTLGAYNDEKDDYEGFSFDEFEFGLGLGFRVVLLVFSYEMDLIGYSVTYENGEGWKHSWSALGGMFGDDASVSQPLSVRASDGQTYGVRVSLPFSTEYTQQVYSGDAGGISTFAFRPTDNSVPFELSGYGSSGDAFKLVDGVASGYDYQVVTVGSQNYVVYTISRFDDGALHPVDYTMLVMSRLRLTNEDGTDSYGLVNPVDADARTPYILLDTINGEDDGAGDLDFNVWVENETIHAAWVSYAEPADLDAMGAMPEYPVPRLSDGTEMNEENYQNPGFAPASSEDVDAAYDAWYRYFDSLASYNDQVQNVAAAAARNTVVKTASFEPGVGFTEAAVISGTAGDNVFLPNGAGNDIVVYGKADHFTVDELNTAASEYQTYLDGLYPSDDTANAQAYDQVKAYRAAYQKGLWDAYGKGSKLCVSVNGTVTQIALPDGQILENIEATDMNGSCYVAYTTGQQEYQSGNLVNIHRLYLLKLETGQDGVTVGDTLLLRTLCDYDQNSETVDGVYSGTALTALYTDPYFSNLQFLQGKLGGLQGTSEAFSVQAAADTDDKQTFLLFEMNGSTYVIPQADLTSIAGESHSGQIIPFFTPEAVGVGDETPSATGRMEVTIGADGAGNISAVYVSSVPNTTNNAIYLTKWDPTSSTWGVGTMLAMNYMQVYEDAAENGWSAEDTEKAYLGKLEGYDRGGMDQLTFSNLQIALGQTKVQNQTETPGVSRTSPQDENGEPTEPESTEVDAANSSRDTLLVLTRGSMRYLEERTTADGKTILSPMSGEKEAENYDEARKPGVGFYAVSYGVGERSIGHSRLVFRNYDFSAGSELYASVSFTNTGDVAIRASEQNPATVSLQLYTPFAAYDGEGDGSENITTLASWTLTENVRSGQTVSLSGECAELTQNLPTGSIFYMDVTEDADYIEGMGGTAFAATTLVYGDDGTPVDGDFVIEEKPELAMEDVKIASIGADADGNTILQVEFTATNRGNENAENVFAQFRYETAEGGYAPLNISNSSWNISQQQQISTFALRSDPKSNGILYLTSGEGDDGSLDMGMYRTITGTVTVSPEVYQGAITDSLNLHVELFSDADPTINTYETQADGKDQFYAEHGEYNSLNNIHLTSLEHRTFFSTASKVTLALGTTLRLPVSYTTTTGEAPSITAQEVEDQDGKQMGILYYEDLSAGNGMIVMTPSGEGAGVIHLKDEATNTIRSIPYEVLSAGSGIDIYEDNGIFTFYNTDDTVYNAAAIGQSWDFQENQLVWGSGIVAEVPMRNNLSKGLKDSYFTFNTMASSMSLYFEGTVEVSSTASGFTAGTYTAAGGNAPVVIDFGENPNNEAHTVTVKVTSASARFDRMTETYSTAQPPTPSDDATAPHIYWSRSFPETASIKTGESVTLVCYVLDDVALAGVTLNGSAPADLQKNSDGFWQFPVTVTENGSISISATDSAGNRTARPVQVDWFNAVVTEGALATAPALTGQFQTEDGAALTEYLPKGAKAYLAAVEPTDDGNLSATRLTVIETGEHTTELVEIGLTEQDGRFDATANGWYLLKLEAKNGTWSQVILEMSLLDGEIPTVSLTETAEPEWALAWSASKSDPKRTPFKKVTINGAVVEIEPNQTRIDGIWKLQYSGTYTLEVTDEVDNKNTAVLNVANKHPLDLSGAENLLAVQDALQDAANGTVTVDLTGITGGKYVESVLQTNGDYVGSYEFCVVSADNAELDAVLKNTSIQWKTSGSWENLPAGNYLLCIRDAQDQTNAEVAVTVTFTVGSYTVSLTETDEPEWALSWSASKSESGRPPFTKVTINGAEVEIEAGKTRIAGTWPLDYSGTYTLEVTDETGIKNSVVYPVDNKHPLDLSEAKALLTVDDALHQDAANGSVAVDLTGITGGKYVESVFQTNGDYVGSYEFCVVPADGADLDAVLKDTSIQWKTSDTWEGLAAGRYLLCIRDAQDPTNADVAVTKAFAVKSDTIALAEINEPEWALSWSASKSNSGRPTFTKVAINGANVEIEPNQTRIDGIWKLQYSGTYTLAVTDEVNHTNTAVLEIANKHPLDLSGAENLLAVQDALQDAANGTVTVDLTGITGGKYVESVLQTNGDYVGSYEFCVVSADGAELDAVLKNTSIQWKTSGSWENLPAGNYLLCIRDAQDQTNAEVAVTVAFTVGSYTVSLTETDEPEWALSWSASKSESGRPPFTKVTINGAEVEIEAGKTRIAGTWPLDYSGTYTLEVTDEAGIRNTIAYTVENKQPLELSGAKNLITVEDAWNQAADNGKVTVELTGITGGKYVERILDEQNIYAGSYEFCVVSADNAELDAVLKDTSIQWKTSGNWEGLAAGKYLLCIRDAQDPTNADVAVMRSFTVGSDAITFETQITDASRKSAADGVIRVYASGGRGEYSGRYQFIVRPMTDEDSPLIAIEDLTVPMNGGKVPAWQPANLSGEDLPIGVLDGLRTGWYQVAVRTMENVSQDELDDLQAAYDALLAAQTLMSEANAALTLSGLTKAEKRLLEEIEAALTAWNTAVDSEKAHAEAVYKALIGNDQTVLDALAAWQDATGRNKASKQRVYNAAVAAYVKRTVKAEAETAKTEAEAALESAETAYLAKKAALEQQVDGAYAADPGLWENAYTTKVYVGYIPSAATGGEKEETDADCDGGRNCPMYRYDDLDTDAWYHDGVHFCLENGLMNGVSDNLFAPGNTTTRAMVVTILWRLEGEPTANNRMDFSDVAVNMWYTEAIRWAASKGIVEGYGDTFGPNDPITREQMAAIMWRYAKYKGYDVSVGENTNILSYDDAFDVSDWAIPAMQWACGAGLINGMESGRAVYLKPADNTTRAQAAAILQRFCENTAKQN